MSAVAQHFLVTVLLKLLQKIPTSAADEAAPAMLHFVQTLTKSPFMLVCVIAKACFVYLQSYLQPNADTRILVQSGEVDFIAKIIHDLPQDSLRRRYYLSTTLHILQLLCSNSMNTTHFASHRTLSELERLMDGTNEEEEAIIADLIWKISGGSHTETEYTYKSLPKCLPGGSVICTCTYNIYLMLFIVAIILFRKWIFGDQS